MAAPTIPLFAKGERPTADKLNTIFSTLSNMFGALSGSDFNYPLVLNGDLDMDGNRLLGVREIFGILNIDEFGADSQAFDDAVSNLSGGGLIFIPRNTTVTLSRGIKIGSTRNRVYILGSGASSVLKLGAGTDDAVISMDGSRRFAISNLTIDGNSDNNESGVGIQCRQCREFEIRNVWIGNDASSGMASDGIYCQNSSNFTIKRAWIRNPKGHAINVSGCDDFNILHVTMDSTGQGNDDYGNMTGSDSHIFMHSGSTNGRVVACTSLLSPQGCIYVTDCDHITVGPGNMCYDWAQRTTTKPVAALSAGHASTDENDPNEGIVFVGNHLDGNNQAQTYGIGVTGRVYGQVIGNSMRRLAHTHPMWADPDTDVRVDFRNNMIMNVPSHGKMSFLAAAQITQLDIGVSNLPLASIQATWNLTSGSPITLKNSVIGARYSGKTITFYNSSAIAGVTDFWYSIEV